MVARIGLIGGLSWEATACYYRYFNEYFVGPSPWSQPALVIDSTDMARIVELQRADDWSATGEIMADAARRLERAGASVLGIGANTMHRNYAEVVQAVACPVVDIRQCVAEEVTSLGGTRVGILGTAYVTQQDFYSSGIEKRGIQVLRPNEAAVQELQRIIFEELTQGIVSERSRGRVLEIGASLVARGADVVGLCCTEFGLLVGEHDASYAVVDSTKAHVRALLAALDSVDVACQ